jgi:hypothetical protein
VFNDPSHQLTPLLWYVDDDRGVRIAPNELLDCALYLNFRIHVLFITTTMVRVSELV